MAKNNNLQDFVTDIADAIREKKGTEDKINPQDFADEIRDIHEEVDMLGFSKIGYTKENDGGIQEAIDYAYNLAKGWNPDGSTTGLFRGNKQLVFAPMVDTSKVTDLTFLFSGCSLLYSVPLLDLSNAIIFNQTFSQCPSLLKISLDLRSAENMNATFSGCTALLFANIFNSNKVGRWYTTFSGCSSLLRIFQLDFSSANTTSMIFNNCNSLLFINITNLGKSTLTTYDFSGATYWGTVGEENRLSLVDSLLTYSYDRAANGLPTATIKLSATTKALLTEEEIALITAKGYTIA